MNKEQNGLNNSVNQKLIDLDVSTIGLNEINAALNSGNANLNEGDRKETIDNLKKPGGPEDDDLAKIIDPPVVRPDPPQGVNFHYHHKIRFNQSRIASISSLDPNIAARLCLLGLYKIMIIAGKADYRISVGRPVDEALEVQQSVYDEAIKLIF